MYMFMSEPTLKKFKSFLEKTEEVYGSLPKFFSSSNAEELFTDFSLLSKAVIDANLNVIEVLHIFSYVVISNQKVINKIEKEGVENAKIIDENTIAFNHLPTVAKNYEAQDVLKMTVALENLGISKAHCVDLQKLLSRTFESAYIKEEKSEIIEEVCTRLEERKKELENIVSQFNAGQVAIKIDGYISRRIPKKCTGEELRKKLNLALEEEYLLLIDTIKFLKTDKNILQKERHIYVTFDLLVEDLELLKFKKREIMVVLFQIIKKNIAVASTVTSEIGINYATIFQYNWEHLEPSKLLAYFLKESKNKFINTNKNQMPEITNYKKFCYEILAQIISSTIVLDIFYFSNKEYTLSDIEKVYQGLMSMNIPENICEYIKYQLIKDLKERDKIQKSEQSKEVVKPQTVTKETKKYLTDQEYKELRKKVKEYFDFYHMKLLKEEITYEEIMECAKNAHLLGIEDSTIELFFRKAGLKEKQNIYDLETQSIAYYISVFDKLQFYSEKLGISTLLKDLNECLQNMMITNQKNYIEFKQLFEEYLSELPDLKEDYKYELSLIKNENKDRKSL